MGRCCLSLCYDPIRSDRIGPKGVMGLSKRRFKLIIFNISKDLNIGTLYRSAYAFGVDEILLVGRRRFKVTGASGTHHIAKTRHFLTMPEAVAYCREEGFAIYGVEIGGTPITECRFDEDIAFVMGNEGRGISDAGEFCDRIVTVPQWGGVPSLNVAVATGIVMFQFQSKQGFEPAEIIGERYLDDFYTVSDI